MDLNLLNVLLAVLVLATFVGQLLLSWRSRQLNIPLGVINILGCSSVIAIAYLRGDGLNVALWLIIPTTTAVVNLAIALERTKS